MRTRILTLCLGALLSAVATAQDKTDKAAARLQALLSELATTDAKAWAERLAALEQQAKANEQEAGRLRQQATALQQQAAAKDAAAKQLRAEIEQLQKLQALAASLPKPAATPGAAAEPAAKEKTAPKPAMPAPKPEAKTPPKPETKKPDAKAAATPPAETPKVAQPPKDTEASPDFVTWDNHIGALFDEHCASCHDPDSKKGGLDVTSFAATRQGGGSGRTLVAGEPDNSRLFLMLDQRERPYMPKGEDPLPAEAIAKVRKWIEQGACEDEAGAREFTAEKAKVAAAAAAETRIATGTAAPMPGPLPAVRLQLPDRPAAIKSLARSGQAPLLAMPGMQQVLLFDAGLQPLGILACPLPQVEAVGFSADGAVLFAAGGERGKRGQVVLYDVRSGKVLATLGKERDTPLAAAVSHARGFVALGGSGKHARVYRLDGSELFDGKHDDFVLGLDFSADGDLLAAADRSGIVQVYETRGGRIGQTLSGHQGAVNAVAFRGNKLLATAGADGSVRLWDATTGKEQWRQGAHQGEALAVAFGPDDRLASCGSDGRIRVFTTAGKPVAQSPDAGEWLYGAAFGASGDVVFAGDWQGRVHRFDLKTKKLVDTTPLAAAQ